MIGNILLAVSGLTLLVLCLGVFLSNSRKPVNRALTAFLFSGFLWVLANLLANLASTKGVSLFFTRITIVGGALSALTFLVFVMAYTRHRKTTHAYIAKIAILPFLLIISSPTSWNILSSNAHGNNVVVGPLYLLLITVLISYYAYGIYIMARFYRHASTIERAQLQYIFAGLTLTVIPGVITNVILPTFGSSEASAYGSISVVAISVFTSIAIVKHRLLDIKLVVARSLAYILLTTTLGSVFAGLLFGITALFLDGEKVSSGAKVAYIIVALLLAFIFQPLKRVFDRLTNSLFYQDAYEPQVFIDQLNKAIVANIRIDELLSKTSRIVADNIKLDYCYFVLKESQDQQPRVFGTSGERQAINTIDVDFLDDLTKEKHILIVDYAEHLSLDKIARLNDSSIGGVVSIKPRSKDKNLAAYMILGIKKSGNQYMNQDIRILNIISNEMSVALQNALQFEEISRFNVTLQQKVDEATKELKKANSKLRELDKTKDEFISMASHQLRTPLTTVKGYLSMILDGDTGAVKKEQKDLIQHSFDGAQRMVYLIADLLNVSRLQTGKFVIDNKPTMLADVVEGEIEQLKEQAANREIQMIYKKPEHFPVLNLDETKIRQVIMNFLDNALYYTPKGGKVEVVLAATDSSVSYTVTDTGVGVPKSVQHHLFSKFYRADNARKMRPDGTGLGLFMAKKVIVAQGGAIIFSSTEGKGSTFGFSFPRKSMEIKGDKATVAGQPIADKADAPKPGTKETPTPAKT